MTRHRLAILSLVLFAATAFVFEAAAQFELPKRLPRIPVDKIPGLDKVPGLDKLLGKEAPITTSLPDVLTEVPFLDSFNPVLPMSAGYAERTSDAQFRLTPGAWTYVSQSYCLKAGTHAPGRGAGYAYAPLKGPKADIVQSILRRSIEHPEVRQQDIQVLLWAIIARAKLSEMPRQYQLTAARLLTPKELFELNGGALGILPDNVKARLMADLPPALKAVIEAENRLRQMLNQANASFDELERVAVLLGDPPPTPGDRSDLPDQRWSYHPDGYFVRFDPSVYSRTQVDIYVPKPYTIVRDRHDRIILLSDQEGRRIDIVYAPSRVKSSSEVQAHKFSRVRFIDERAGVPEDILSEWTSGWTLLGVPDPKNNTVAGETAGMADISARLAKARRQKDEIEKFLSTFPKVRGSKRGQRASSQAVMRDLIDLANLYDGLAPLAAARTKAEPRVAANLQKVQEAWQFVLHRGVSESPELRASLSLEGPGRPGNSSGDGGVAVDPAGNVGVPGRTGRQRLGQSGRCAEECGCDRKKFCNDLSPALNSVNEVMRSTQQSTVAFPQLQQNLRPQLRDLQKDLCDNPAAQKEIDDMLRNLSSLRPGNSLDWGKVNSIAFGLEQMQKQMCTPKPPKGCKSGEKKVEPGQEQAKEQFVEGLNEAIEQLKETAKKIEGTGGTAAQQIEDIKSKIAVYEKAKAFWDNIKAGSCVPQDVLQTLMQVANDRRASGYSENCAPLCNAAAEWFGSMNPGPQLDFQKKVFRDQCMADCG